MKKRSLRTIWILLLAAVLLAGGVFAAAIYGSRDDPLVTLSYLNDVAEHEITDRTDQSIRDAVSGAQAKVQENLRSAVGVFQSVSLTAGQTLRCEAGTEILLLSGSAVTTGPFADVTTGETLSADSAITANHLLLAGEDAAALQAKDAVRLMVRGGCQLAG